MNAKQSFQLVFIFAISLIISAVILSNGISSLSNSKNIITVTGSAREQITSDFGYMVISVNVKSSSSDDAYRLIEEKSKYVIDFYKKLNDKELSFNTSNVTISSVEKYGRNGETLNEISHFNGNQIITISSKNVKLINEISKANTRELYNLGIEVYINAPSYTYSKVQDLKISMQAKATLDAKERAIKIAEASGVSIDKLVNARMGVIQIVPRGSNEVSDWGNNDETSIEKDIISVVSVSFNVK